jgi:Double-stranded RNA binding motif
MSSKNILQEWCQKMKLPLPIYNTVRIGGDDTHPIFASTVTIGGNYFTETEIGCSKIEAEKAVAKTAYDTPKLSLSQKYADIRDIPIDNYRKIYLIDGDNYHITEEKVFEESSSLFIYFVAKNNTGHIPVIQQQTYENCCIFISDSIGRDAVDHLITFYLGKMSILWNNEKNYFIVTRDHFGECIEKFMSNCKLVCEI